jgi:hypothetical protein
MARRGGEELLDVDMIVRVLVHHHILNTHWIHRKGV